MAIKFNDEANYLSESHKTKKKKMKQRMTGKKIVIAFGFATSPFVNLNKNEFETVDWGFVFIMVSVIWSSVFIFYVIFWSICLDVVN